ncbi:MAG: Rpn family recombination-promoting nuclease/putative transposase [Prevotellaceae bacterium]|jgi:predicted transposase/invertase (TIGR01784 family)|nr:Rpn family recombination-promoting nuclease/putative transposase [Prevotellaceae bacterium]
MPRYLDPKNYLTFKRIFGEHKHLCMSLLNNLLPLTASQQIASLEYRQSEMSPEIHTLNNSIVDARCTDSQGRQLTVEMRMIWTKSFIMGRAMFNASKAHVTQPDSAESYKLLQPVYALNLVSETFAKDSSSYYHHYKMANVAEPEKQIEGLNLVFVELTKFQPTGRAEKKLHELWLKFLTGIGEHTEKIPQELLEEEVTKEAVRYLEVNSYTKNQLAAYDKYWDIVRTERSRYLDAQMLGRSKGIEIGIAAGREEGIAVGREEGIAVGKEEGIAVGKAEGEAIGAEKSLKQVVLNALRKGFTVAQIQELTALSREKIEALLTQHNA